ncbi:uncharacterized protein C05D11.1-like [Arctopsyche grandis]|uniref:uncharacterized protein C05D11.1-like n=1 Tax=Arctopsyche grandis TaxID=121162 RepID=UPI00406D9A48
MSSRWSVISKCEAAGATPVQRLRAPSGLRLTLVQVEGPLVASYIALATEAHDDDGLPHTLEHLVFLGSEDYPFKGLLDLFANRCFASGTNAWTDTDHTAYTLKTAGSKGMLKMLPIYMDHILYPLLTNYGYITEVYHITGEGKDAGVVYSEMQGRENSADSRCYRKLILAAYPNSGYSSETGGLMENLRTSTNNEKVKKYHKDFYRPENIVIIIVGQVDCDEVLAALQPIEDKIMRNKANNTVSPFVRPWQSPVPPMKSTDPINEKYPTDSEDSGLIMVGWRGPGILTSKGFYEFTACCILLRYLSDTPIAPFQQALVEIENPFASDVSMTIIENSVPLFALSLENVPLNRLEETLPELKKTITSIASLPNSISIERLKAIIDKQLRETLSQIENNPHDALAFSCISDVLYDLTDEQFEEMLNKQNLYKKLVQEKEEFWKKLFTTYFHTNFLSVIGSPSTDLMVQMFDDEAQRNVNHQETLGKEGLEKKSNELAEAMQYNERDPPKDIFNTIGKVDCDDLKHFTLDMWTSDEGNCPHFPIQDLPFYARINHINSQFTYITLLMSTCGLNSDQRFYLPLLLELLYQSPYNCDGILQEHSTLIEEVEILTNDLAINIGVGKTSGRFCTGIFQQTVSLFVQCEPEKYERVVRLIWCILKNTAFTKSRVLIVAQKMVNDIATIRRQGGKIVTDLLRDLIISKESNVHHCSILRQQRFLNDIIMKLEKPDNEYMKVLENLEETRQKLLIKNNVWLHFAANLKSHQYTAEPWKKYPIMELNTDSSCSDKIIPGVIIEDNTFLIEKEKIEEQGCIVGIGGLESCYVEQYSPGPPSYSHPDVPALLVVLQYFTQLEGSMWRHIRGAGLSYSYSIDLKPNEGLIKFHLFKATNGAKAYAKAKSIIESFLESASWDENLYASAKSSLVYDLVAREASPAKMISQSLLNYYKKVDLKHNLNLVKKVMNITKDELMEVAKRWLPSLFDPKKATLAIVCNPSKVEEMKASFKEFGYDDLNIYKSLEDSHLSE